MEADSGDEAGKRHPYSGRPASAFWKETVSGNRPLEITDWYKRKFDISGMPIATAGSCFAQHIGRAVRYRGYPFIDVEPAPAALPAEDRHSFGFETYSARFGNIYTSRQLLQLVQRATGELVPLEDHWSFRDGFVDPFRPTIEPTPFESVEELRRNREAHLKRVLRLFAESGLLIFTLGLTETWASRSDGSVFPLAPGVAGGAYDPDKHAFINLSYPDVVEDMEGLVSRVREFNPRMHFILTVSPVPLAATATPDNVVVATVHSKSVLRAACGHLASKFDFVDYFPSYEIISSHPMKGIFYAADGRSVTPDGVEHVMGQFFSAHPPPAGAEMARSADPVPWLDSACDEELLAAARRQS